MPTRSVSGQLQCDSISTKQRRGQTSFDTRHSFHVTKKRLPRQHTTNRAENFDANRCGEANNTTAKNPVRLLTKWNSVKPKSHSTTLSLRARPRPTLKKREEQAQAESCHARPFRPAINQATSQKDDSRARHGTETPRRAHRLAWSAAKLSPFAAHSARATTRRSSPTAVLSMSWRSLCAAYRCDVARRNAVTTRSQTR